MIVGIDVTAAEQLGSVTTNQLVAGADRPQKVMNDVWFWLMFLFTAVFLLRVFSLN